MGKYDDRPYEVGKGKPPRQHQFQPGQSGNPKGPQRRNKTKKLTMQQLFNEAVNEPVTIVVNGQKRRVPKKQAITIGVVNDALTGTPAQRIKALSALHEHGAFDATVEEQRLDRENEQEKLAKLIEALAEEARRSEEARASYAEYYNPNS